MAGYQGQAYDEYVAGNIPLALLAMYGAGLWYHNMPGQSNSQHDPFDNSGFPYITFGAESVPESWALKNGVYDVQMWN